MKPGIAEIVLPEDWELFEKIRSIVFVLPATILCRAFICGIPLGRDIAESKLIPNCHEIARALAYFLPVTVHDGMISEKRPDREDTQAHKHSWLTRIGGNDAIIFDPWPLGSVSGPAVFVQDYAFRFHKSEFINPPMRNREFRSHVAATRLAIRKVLQAA